MRVCVAEGSLRRSFYIIFGCMIEQNYIINSGRLYDIKEHLRILQEKKHFVLPFPKLGSILLIKFLQRNYLRRSICASNKKIFKYLIF